MNKTDRAVNYKQQYELNFANSERKLPNVDCVFTNSVQAQTDNLPIETIDKFVVFKMHVYTVCFPKYLIC